MSSEAAYFPDARAVEVREAACDVPEISTDLPGKTSHEPAEDAAQGFEASDEKLLDQVRDGEREALALLFRRHARAVRNVAYRILRDEAEADDLVQEVFLYLFRKAALYDSAQGKAVTWIIHVAYHRAFDRRRYLNSRHFYTNRELEDRGLHLADPRREVPFHEQSMEGILGKQLLATFNTRLTPGQRETIELFFLRGIRPQGDSRADRAVSSQRQKSLLSRAGTAAQVRSPGKIAVKVSELGHNGSSQGAWMLPQDPHEEFRELCALSTTGELTAEEWTRLSEHLAHCGGCREAKQQYEHVIAMSMPALAAETTGERDDENAPGAWKLEEAEAALMKSLRAEPRPPRTDSVASGNSLSRKSAWKYAIAAAVLAAVALAGYRFGTSRQRGPEVAVDAPSLSTSNPSRQQVQPVDSALPAQGNKESREDDEVAMLRSQVRRGERETAGLKGQLSQLEAELARRSADLEQSLQGRAELGRELAEAQANAQTLQAKLAAIGSQTSQDTAELLGLKTRIEDLKASLDDKDKQIVHEQELLAHDQDIRNVIGARNLYIAEIYDVAKNGDTEKPFGRVFYTKEKSLIFYAYDLDQQHGVKKDSAFQAWGRRGADGQHDVSLGLLYQDNAIKKRWVLKFNDAKTIAQFDAVFVTVEPEGGSAKPSGKPLLFTYLRLDPNHP